MRDSCESLLVFFRLMLGLTFSSGLASSGVLSAVRAFCCPRDTRSPGLPNDAERLRRSGEALDA